MSGPTIEVTVSNEGGDFVTHQLPAKLIVCSRCEGTGKHVNPSIDGNGITQSEMAELGEDFREDYMAGMYDVTCSVCLGIRVVPAIDTRRFTPVQRRAWKQHCKEIEESRRDDASEAWLRRAEAGGGW